MRILAYVLISLLITSNAFAQSGSRRIQSSDVTGALGYTPLRSIGAMTGPDILCGAGLNCTSNTISGIAAGTSGQIQYNNSGVLGGFTLNGDATVNTGTGTITLATVNSNVGSFGSATNCVSFTTNAKGLITAAANVICTPNIAFVGGLGTGVVAALGINIGSAGSVLVNGGALGTPSSGTLTNATGLPVATGISGLGTGVATALAINTGSAGAPVLFNGALGTPSSGVGTNLTGTASGLTAGSFSAGSAANLNSGILPAARTNGHLNGTATNDNAAAGEIGEFVSSTVLSGSAVALTTSVSANITSISLTAGDWDVCGIVDTNVNAATDVTQIGGWISTTSATFPTPPNSGALFLNNWTAASHVGLNDHFPVGCIRQSLNATTTVYLSIRVIFTVNTAAAYGFIRARRVR